ncbi:MAG TPA: DUF4136 domain-containing protein [Candidatus Solibacter sp.]|nr:DUF4136 domain-containing protein [Candidatus Solibacter sp.]
MRPQTATRIALGLVLFSLTAFSAAAQKAEITFDKNAPFKQYKRYAWGKNNLVTRQTPEMEAVIEKKIEADAERLLTSKGFTKDEANPDFLIHYDAGAIPDPGASMPTYKQYLAGGGMISGTISGVTADVWLQIAGHLEFSIQDISSKNVVWKSLVTKKTNDPKKFLKNLDSEINKLTTKALEKFPPK